MFKLTGEYMTVNSYLDFGYSCTLFCKAKEFCFDWYVQADW